MASAVGLTAGCVGFLQPPGDRSGAARSSASSVMPLGTEAPTCVRLPGGGNMTRTSNPPVKAVSADDVGALLDRYGCPVPFPAVRTRFLGNIASPVVSASPLDALKALWGGELPEFDSLDAVNELLAALIMGLWNRLSRHQERSAPFRLLRVDISGNRKPRGHLADQAPGVGLASFTGCSGRRKASNYRSERVAP